MLIRFCARQDFRTVTDGNHFSAGRKERFKSYGIVLRDFGEEMRLVVDGMHLLDSAVLPSCRLDLENWLSHANDCR